MSVHKLSAGPTKLILKDALLDEKTVTFRSSSTVFVVKIMNFELVRENGRFDHWKMVGFFWTPSPGGTFGSSKRCSIRFWPDLREGVLQELPAPSNRFKLDQLDQLSNDELRREIDTCARVAIDWQRHLSEYSAGLSEHDQLLIQALVAKRGLEAGIHTELDHKVYIRTRN